MRLRRSVTRAAAFHEGNSGRASVQSLDVDFGLFDTRGGQLVEKPRPQVVLGCIGLGTVLQHTLDDVVEPHRLRSEEHTSELQSLMRISYAVFCLKKKKKQYKH